MVATGVRTIMASGWLPAISPVTKTKAPWSIENDNSPTPVSGL